MPEAPVTVTVVVPVDAVLAAVRVSVLDEVVLEGLKVAVTPLGRPDADRLTVPLKPFTGLTVIVLVALLARRTLTLAGDADSVKSGTTGALTVSVRVVVRVSVPEAPVTVRVKVPVAAPLAAVSVSVLVEVVLAGLKLAVTPEGSPEIERFTVPLKPLTGFTVMVLFPLLPCTRVNEFGEAERLKSGWFVFHTSVMGETLALWPACGSP